MTPTPSSSPRPGAGAGPGPKPASAPLLRGVDPSRLDIDARVILLAAVVSLGLHVAILAAVGGKPLSGVDPALLTPAQEVIHIRRAVDQDTVDDAGGAPIIAANPHRQATRPPSEAEASRQAIETTPAFMPAGRAQPAPLLATPVTGPRVIEAAPRDPGRAGGLRDASQLGGAGDPNSPPGQAAGPGGVSGPRVDLPAAMAQTPAINHGVELDFTGPATGDRRLGVNGGTLVPGPGRGKSVDGNGSGGSGLARDALTDQSTMPGISLGPPPFEPTRPDQSIGAPVASLPSPATTPLAPADIQAPTVIAPSRLDAPEHLDEDFDYILSAIPPRGSAQGYLQVQFTPKRSLHRLKTMPKDVVFLVDTSLSIPEEWAQAVAQGVRDSLASLNPGDRFNIVLFNQSMEVLAPDGVMPATDENIARGEQFLAHVYAGGLTDINKAVSHLLVRDVSVQRVYDIVFISDGQPTEGVKDMRELLNGITRDNDLAASIYCVGVGVEPDHALLEFLAYRNKGFCSYAFSPERAPGVIRDLMSRIRYPIVKNVRADVAGIDDTQVFPRDLPDIHQGESFSIYGRYDHPGPFTMRLAGQNGAKPVDLTFSRDLSEADPGGSHLPREWAFWKLHHLYSEVISKGETPEIRAAIEALRKEFGLKTVY